MAAIRGLFRKMNLAHRQLSRTQSGGLSSAEKRYLHCIRSVTKLICLLERFCSLRTGQHILGFYQSIDCLGVAPVGLRPTPTWFH